jgi:hypothetical protein
MLGEIAGFCGWEPRISVAACGTGLDGDHSQDGITSVEVHQCIECIEARRSNIQADAAGSGGQSR